MRDNKNLKFAMKIDKTSKINFLKIKDKHKLKTISFYKFFNIKRLDLKDKKNEVLNLAQDLKIKGLILISEEGLNGSFCGTESSIEQLKAKLEKLFKQKFFWKDSFHKKQGFKRLSVKIKTEIINIGTRCHALKGGNNHLSPKEWEEKLNSKKIQVLDVRNTYEVEVGLFKGAKHLRMENFQEFPKKIENSRLNKEKETLIYCTGGIRCEKAIQLMKGKGFKKVYQLEGGILNYLKYYPNSYFKKECFVFDHRTALDQNLEVSKKYSLCPHCGQAGDLKTNCLHCEKEFVICRLCHKKSTYYQTCSKNCAYHFKAGHKCRKKYLNR